MPHDGMGQDDNEGHADDVRRGLLVVGELQDSQQAAAAARIGAALGWPVVADVLSGELIIFKKAERALW
jgi:2-succinyl-5-enolpyruvyl-6-hydroxy-3-cyclohexene-1-carboxylate synthase